jgi:hypothetical protein
MRTTTVLGRSARGWGGRYSGVSAVDIDSILKYFHPNLGQFDNLTGDGSLLWLYMLTVGA